ncbi:MAG: sulfatase [Verrucomicrobiota bacterium]
MTSPIATNNRTPILLVGLLLLLAFLSSTAAAEKPNFVLILTDDQSWVGSSQEIIPGDSNTKSNYFQTPQIERIASMGMTFTQGYSPAASCCPTRRSIQTGLTPARHEYNADREGWTSWYARQLNITRMLEACHRDYQTAHFGKWDHRYDEISPHDQEYDFSDGYTGNGEGGSRNSGGPAATPDPKRVDSITDKALHFIDFSHASGRPFFLQVSHYAVHLDVYYREETLKKYQELPPGKKHNMPEFAAMTEDMDTSIGRILDKLEERDLLGNTYIIFLSDNGGRNDIPKAPPIVEHRNAPLRDGKHTFYEGGIRVPFFITGPGVNAGSVSNVPVTGLDILPTLADLAGYPKELPRRIDGGSLREVLENEGEGTVQRTNPFLVFHQSVDRSPMSALRHGDYKLVKTGKKEQLELFDLSKDISESNDLSEEMPRKTEELHLLLNDFLKEVGAETKKTE